MNKKVLKGISKENKKVFLEKLASGKYTLLPAYEPQPPLYFDLREDGLYKCREDGRVLTSEQISALPGYSINLELVSDRFQLSGAKPAEGYHLVPFTESEWLNSLLKSESDKILSYDESDGLFKTGNEAFTFDQLMRIQSNTHDNPEFDFVMDEATSKKYLELLENWC